MHEEKNYRLINCSLNGCSCIKIKSQINTDTLFIGTTRCLHLVSPLQIHNTTEVINLDNLWAKCLGIMCETSQVWPFEEFHNSHNLSYSWFIYLFNTIYWYDYLFHNVLCFIYLTLSLFLMHPSCFLLMSLNSWLLLKHCRGQQLS